MRYPVAAVGEYLVGWRQHGSNMSADLEAMHRAICEVHGRLAAERLPIAKKVLRRAIARSCLELAEKRAWNGQFGGARRKLVDALRFDPARTSLYLAYRLARSVGRRTKQRPKRCDAPNFYELDTTSFIQSDPDELRWLWSSVESLDRRRFEQLLQAATVAR